MTTGLPSNSTVAVATLGKVSVVMMASAASSHGPSLRRPAISLTTPENFSAGSGSPITPVEARKMSPDAQPSDPQPTADPPAGPA